MRPTLKDIEAYRVLKGEYASPRGAKFGAFRISMTKHEKMVVLFSSDMGWEHASASYSFRTPTWEEMCFVKDMFWSPHECVVQYHPPRASHVNFHRYTLHLWRPTEMSLPMPPTWLVGPLK